MPSEIYILDTSSLVSYLAQETGSEQIKKYRNNLQIPFIVLTETYYVTFRKQGHLVAEEIMHHILSWHFPILKPDEQICLLAGFLKGQYKLGIADSYIAAFALNLNATLLTKDHDYRAVQIGRAHV